MIIDSRMFFSNFESGYLEIVGKNSKDGFLIKVQDIIYFASTYPYPYSRLVSFIREIKDNKYVKIDELGKSEDNRDIFLVTITNFDVSNNFKKTIFINAGFHGGETSSMYAAEGIIEFLISGEKEVQEIRNRMVFKIIPIVNVYAQVLGLDRRNKNGVNLWYDWNKFTQKETRIVRDSIINGNPDVYLDIHGWHFFGNGCYQLHHTQISSKIYEKIEKLREYICKYFPMKNILYLNQEEKFKEKPTESPNGFVSHKLGIPTLTPEISFCYDNNGNCKKQEDMKREGVQIIWGIVEYFKKLVKIKKDYGKLGSDCFDN